MKIISGIINIAIGLFIGLFAHTALNQYFVGNQEDIDKYESLLKNGISTVALLDSSYSETTVKIKGIEAKVYEIDYTFQVDNNDYEGRYFFEHPDSLTSEVVEIKYLKNDPIINAANVERELEKKKAELNSNSDLWFALGITAISLFLLIVGLRNIIKGIKSIRQTKKS